MINDVSTAAILSMVCFEYLKTVCLKVGRKCYIFCTDVIANCRFRYQDGFISLTLSTNVYWRIYDVMSCDRFSHHHTLKSPNSGNEKVLTTAIKFVLTRLESSEVYSLFAIYLWQVKSSTCEILPFSSYALCLGGTAEINGDRSATL